MKVLVIQKLLPTFVVITLHFMSTNAYNYGPYDDSVKSWGRNLESEFGNIYEFLNTEKFTPSASPSYNLKYFDDRSARIELDRIISRLEKLTKRKQELVTNLREAAEDYYKNFDTNQTISCDTYVYDRAKAIATYMTNETLNPTGKGRCQSPKYIPLIQSPLLYNISVNFDRTTAHVPTNVYDGSKSILMVANWTESLDLQLRSNFKSDPTLKWQYFASSHGLFKVFPGVRWHIQIDEIGEESPVDFFDCRSQTWYIEAAAYPKDIVILVDKSGSMKGRRETIANLTVSEILTTLTENDFFNVILFNENIFYADPIFSDVLLQATMKNKQRIMDMLNITPSGIANYEIGLKAAFSLLKESRESGGASSYCNQAIMIISDGAPDYYESLFQELNPEKDVRVFTYMISREASDRENVQRMACNNRGFFVQISTLADVKENVQTYLPVMARTNALHRERYTVWTGVHDRHIRGESVIPKPPEPTGMPPTTEIPTTTTTPTPTTDPHSSGYPKPSTPPARSNKTTKKEPINLFVSVAQAVYDIKEETFEKNIGQLLGVTGLDVPVSEFEKLAPSWAYGIHGYVFAINNNGYVLFHPDFRPIYKNNLKPFYQNVDVAEVEHPADMTLVEGNPNYNLTLRTRMIDRDTGNEEMVVINVPDDYQSIYEKKMKYFFKPLKDTPFSIALALPWMEGNSLNFLQIKGVLPDKVDELQLRDYLANYSSSDCVNNGPSPYGVNIIPYEFCNFNENLTRLYDKDPICAMRAVLLDPDLRKRLSCDDQFLQQIHTDALLTDEWRTTWPKLWKGSLRKRFGIDQVFMLRYSGLIRSYNESLPIEPNFINMHREGNRDPVFEGTVDFGELLDRKDYLYFHVPSHDIVKRRLGDGKKFSITASSTTYMKNALVPSGVVGVQINYDKLRELFVNSTSKCEGRFCITCNSPDVDCYLLSYNGFVISSLRDDLDVGKPFGEVDCEIMKSMLDNGIFSNRTIYDFQAVCTYPLTDSSFANRLIDPISRFIGYCIWLLYNLSIFIFEFFSTTLWVVAASAQEYLTLSLEPKTRPSAPNHTVVQAKKGDPDLVRRVEKYVNICRNHTDMEDRMKCFQDFLNTLCRRVGTDSGNDCITACKLIREYSPDHWNAHEKCVYPSKPCSKEFSVFEPAYLRDGHRSGSIYGSTIYDCCSPNRKSWKAVPVKNTNLLLVLVRPSRTMCRCRCFPLFQRSQELKAIWSNISQPYRRHPGWNCDTNRRKENDSSCSNGGTRIQCLYGFYFLLATLLLLRHNR